MSNVQACKAIETTNLHNKTWRTFQPFYGAGFMRTDLEANAKSREYEAPLGRDVFHWPEFQALAKRLMIDMTVPITEVTIKLPCEGLAVVTVKSHALDAASKR